MSAVLQFEYKLTRITCCECFIPFAMPESLRETKLRDGGSFFCPNGHSQHFTETEVVRLQKEAKRLEDALAFANRRVESERSRREAAERQASATKGQITKLKCRIGNGICPCCNRSFANLKRHMATKHPDEAKGDT